VAALLDDAAAFEDVDAVGVHDRREAMGNQNADGFAALGDFADGGADCFFGERVQGRSGFIEHHEVRLAEEAAGDQEPLFFAAGDFDAAFADFGGEAFIGKVQERSGRGLFENEEAFGVGGVWLDEAQVFGDGAGEKLGVLGDEADAFAKGFEVDFVVGNAVVENAAIPRFVEAHEEFDEGGLTGAGRSDEGDGLAAVDGEGDVGEGRGGGALVLEGDVVEG